MTTSQYCQILDSTESGVGKDIFKVVGSIFGITQSKVYEISIPPGSGNAIEVIFPEEGTYFGNDHDLGRVLSGAGFPSSLVLYPSTVLSHVEPIPNESNKILVISMNTKGH